MPIEIEVKLRVASFAPVRRQLEALGARRLSSVIESNVILDNAGADLRRNGTGLRIRESNPTDGRPGAATVTFKGPPQQRTMKVREEIEFAADQAEPVRAIFARLGFMPVLIYEKRRESWKLDDCRIELDEPAALGRFVEIEGPSESSIRSVQQRLNLADATHEPSSYVGLLMNHCKERSIHQPVLKLRPGGPEE